jgi:hypothetical protein
MLAVARDSCKGASLPRPRPFTIGPVTRDRFTLKVTVFVTVALLEQLQKWIAERRVHPNALSRVVTSHIMPRKALLKQGLLKCTAAIKVPRRSHPRRVGTALSA